MMKFLCLDFDGTLSTELLAGFIKKIVDQRNLKGEHQLKIGIVTSRSIYDDFRTFGQFQDEIVDVLARFEIKLDFICTRFALHVMSDIDYEKMSVREAIVASKPHPIFADYTSNYLLYRETHKQLITALRESSLKKDAYQIYRSKLWDLVDKDVEAELKVREEVIQPDLKPGMTAKIHQLEATLKFYGCEPMKSEVLLLDDALKHVAAVSNYPSPNWHGELFTGLSSNLKARLREFSTGSPSVQPRYRGLEFWKKKQSVLPSLAQDSNQTTHLSGCGK
jgi:hypothetical protein